MILQRGQRLSLTRVLVAALWLLVWQPAVAQECSAVFPGPAQKSDTGGTIRFQWRSSVTGAAANTLETPTINDGSGWFTNSCDTANCNASGGVVPQGSYTGGYPGGPSITTNWGQSITVSPGNYANLTHGGNGTISMEPGIYTFSGSISANNNAVIAVASPGTVAIFVDGNVNLGYRMQLNSASTDRYLFIFSEADITADNEIVLNGVLYGINIRLGYQSIITGAVTATNNVRLENESRIDYDNAAIANADFYGFCSQTGPPLPSLVAEWRFDELLWDGTANEVLDSSGNNLHGVAVDENGLPSTQAGNPALAGNPGTCRSGDFGGQLDGYVQVDDPGTGSVLDLTSYTVSSWIYIRSLNDTISTIVSKDENFEYHINDSGQVYWWWGSNDRSLTVATPPTLNEWHHIVITFKPGTQHIYVDGALAVSNNSNTAATLNNDPVLMGTDLDFPARRFDGLIDEVRLYDGPLTPSQVTTLFEETHPCAVEILLDHFTIDVGSGSASVCVPERITITAEDSANNVVSDYTGTISITTSTHHGSWSTTATPADARGVFTAGTSDSGSASYAFESSQLDAGSVALNLANQHAETLTIQVEDTDAGVVSTSVPLTFSENAFVVTATDVLAEDVIVGRDHAFKVEMVQRDDTGVCSVATDYDLAAVKVWLTRASEDPGAPAPRVTNADGSDIEILADSAPATSNLSFPFVDGVANFTLASSAVRADVGKYVINFRDDSSGFSDLPINGDSNTLVARPFGFDIQVSGNPGATGASGPAFTTAGSDFTTQVRAVAWQAGDDTNNDGIADGHNDNDPTNNADLSDNPVTQSYGLESPTEAIVLSGELVSPLGGNDPGLGASVAGGNRLTTFVNGIGTTNSTYFAEVGLAELSAIVFDGEYMGSVYSIRLQGRSGYVGRFIPSYFAVTPATITPACNLGGYSYMGEPFSAQFTLDARNAFDVLTQNYTGSYAKFDPANGLGSVNYGAIDSVLPTPLSSRLSGQVSVAWSNGSSVVDNQVVFARSTAPDGPYNLLDIGIDIEDADTIGLRSADLDLDTDNDTTLDSLGLGQTTVRFGRLRLADAFGPESANLAVIFTSEFWSGRLWQQNIDDSCSAIQLTDITYPNGAIDTPANRTIAVGGGVTIGNYGAISASAVTFSGGDAGHFFSAPGVGNTGSFQIDVSVVNYPWFQFDWNGDGDYTDSALPSATFTFGSYRGHDKVIYWREVLN